MPSLSLEDLRHEPTIYLLPEYATEEEARADLKEFCSEIFEEQLDGWYCVPSAWPVDRDFDTFIRWFEYRFHSVIIDLCDDPVILGELCWASDTAAYVDCQLAWHITCRLSVCLGPDGQCSVGFRRIVVELQRLPTIRDTLRVRFVSWYDADGPRAYVVSIS